MMKYRVLVTLLGARAIECPLKKGNEDWVIEAETLSAATRTAAAELAVLETELLLGLRLVGLRLISTELSESP